MDHCGLTEHKTDLISFFMAGGLLHLLARCHTTEEAEELLENILAQSSGRALEFESTRILEPQSSDEDTQRNVQPRDGEI